MTAAQLLAALRAQLADAAKPGLAGVRALEAAGATLAQLEGEIDLMQRRYADKEAVRLGVAPAQTGVGLGGINGHST